MEQGVGNGVGTTQEGRGGRPQLGGARGGRAHPLSLHQEETRMPTGGAQQRTLMGSGTHHQAQVCACVCARLSVFGREGGREGGTVGGREQETTVSVCVCVAACAFVTTYCK